ncbi:hypothetical protein ACFWC5_32455 [Streptomyces sp. NPDC060085]|uniref:hypothetical protein n=1 Tax=Streptomyces sp. NPDC060085 TaxID=3347054 RepID=UPI003650DA8D
MRVSKRVTALAVGAILVFTSAQSALADDQVSRAGTPVVNPELNCSGWEMVHFNDKKMHPTVMIRACVEVLGIYVRPSVEIWNNAEEGQPSQPESIGHLEFHLLLNGANVQPNVLPYENLMTSENTREFIHGDWIERVTHPDKPGTPQYINYTVNMFADPLLNVDNDDINATTYYDYWV